MLHRGYSDLFPIAKTSENDLHEKMGFLSQIGSHIFNIYTDIQVPYPLGKIIMPPTTKMSGNGYQSSLGRCILRTADGNTGGTQGPNNELLGALCLTTMVCVTQWRRPAHNPHDGLPPCNGQANTTVGVCVC